MLPNHAIRRLWWKELRQLLPLVCLLVVMSTLLLVLVATTNSVPSHYDIQAILLGLPSLFAAGVGGILVSQEKDQRTLQWLSSLPIPRKNIVRTKASAAIVCLAIVWLVCGALSAGFSKSIHYTVVFDGSFVLWVIHSIFILLVGLALAWRFQSPMVSLLLIVPMVFVPYLVLNVMASVYGWWNGNRSAFVESSDSGQVLASQLFSTAVAAWFVGRNGQRALSPENVKTGAAWFSLADHYETPSRSAGYGKIQQPLPALLWQFAAQNFWLLTGFACVIVTLVVGLLAYAGATRNDVLLAMELGFVALMATSWLGVIVFQGDNIKHRIRFLADRGVSPSLTWLTRQAIPISILTLFMAGAVTVVALLLRDQPRGSILSVIPYILVGVGSVLLSYLSAQWSGQVSPSPIIAALFAPMVALAAICFFMGATFMLGTPWWIWSLVLPIPAIATWTMMQRWMDRRLGWSYWASHAGFLTAFLVVPTIPFLVDAARQPKMPKQVAVELDRLASHAKSRIEQPVELVLLSEAQRQKQRLERWTENSTPPAGAGEDESTESSIATPIDGPISERETVLSDIERQLNEFEGRPVSAASHRVNSILRPIAILSRMGLTKEPSETKLELYRRTIKILDQISYRMRQSPNLIDQDAADRCDIWLLSEVKLAGARTNLGDALYESIVRRIADRDARVEARRQALAISWKQYQRASARSIGRRVRNATTSVRYDTIGGYEIKEYQLTVGTPKHILTKRRVGVAVADLWELLNAEPGSAKPELLERIARYWRIPPARYGVGTLGNYFRAEDVHNCPFVGEGWQFSQAIANQWSAGWERQAAELLSNLNSDEVPSDE